MRAFTDTANRSRQISVWRALLRANNSLGAVELSNGCQLVSGIQPLCRFL